MAGLIESRTKGVEHLELISDNLILTILAHSVFHNVNNYERCFPLLTAVNSQTLTLLRNAKGEGSPVMNC